MIRNATLGFFIFLKKKISVLGHVTLLEDQKIKKTTTFSTPTSSFLLLLLGYWTATS